MRAVFGQGRQGMAKLVRSRSVNRRIKGDEEQHRLIVLGGSGGARSLNENVPRALYKIRNLLTGWEILHQSGEADVESTRDLYRKFALEARVEAFWPDLPRIVRRQQSGHLPRGRDDACRAFGRRNARRALALSPRHRRSSAEERRRFRRRGGRPPGRRA